MAIQTINIGTTANDGTGDDPRTAGSKINDNFTNSNHAASRDVGTAAGEIQTNSQNRSEFAAKSGGVFTTDITVNSLTVGRGGGSALTNTALGNQALYSNTTGYQNTSSGHQALYSNTTGYYNTALGRLALSTAETFSNCSGLGFNSQVTGSNQIQIGSSSTTCYTNGAVQNRSDIRDKANIRDTGLGLDFINALRPVDFMWDMREDYRVEMPNSENFENEADFKAAQQEWLEDAKLKNIQHDGTHKRSRYHHGLIAQELKAVMDSLGVDFGGFQDHKLSGGDDVLTVGYEELIAPLIKSVQELAARIDLLESGGE